MKVIKIGAVWCSGCLVMKPRWQKIEKESPWLKTEYFDYDQDSSKIKKYNIDQGILPVFIFLDKKGKIIDKLQGEVDEKTLIKKIEEYRKQ